MKRSWNINRLFKKMQQIKPKQSIHQSINRENNNAKNATIRQEPNQTGNKKNHATEMYKNNKKNDTFPSVLFCC